MTRLRALTAALAIALAGYAASSSAKELCVTVTPTDHIVDANKMVKGPGVITTTITPIPPGC